MLKPSLLILLLSLKTMLHAAEPDPGLQNEVCYSDSPRYSNKEQPNPSLRNDTCARGPKHMRISARHIEGGGIGYNKGYTTLEAFIASDPNRWCLMPFLDLRGHVFNDGKMAANAGIGMRSILGSRAYGVNAYYDYRNTNRRGYNQVSMGVETLGQLWDLRVNGYLPVGGKVTSAYDSEFTGFQGNSIMVNQRYQFAMKGIDAEMGFHFGKTSNFDFYGAAGPYYFKGDMGKGSIGGKVRLSGSYKQYVTLEVSDSYDNVFHNNVQGQITFTLPLGPKSKPKVTKKHGFNTCESATTMTSRMIQPVNRQEIVVVDAHTRTDVARATVGGKPYNIIFVDNRNGSLGTSDDPFATLADAAANSGSGDIISVSSGDGLTTGYDQGITLQDGQKLWGSGVAHSLELENGSVIYIPPTTLENPSITNINTDGMGITLASNNEVSGINIINTNGAGIYGTNPGNLSILSTWVDSPKDYGIYLRATDDQRHTVSINKVFINAAPYSGLAIYTYNNSNINATVINALYMGNGSPIDFQSYDYSFLGVSCDANGIFNNSYAIYLGAENDSQTAISLSNSRIIGPVDSSAGSALYGSSGGRSSLFFAANNLIITNNLTDEEQQGLTMSSYGRSILGVNVLNSVISGCSHPIDFKSFNDSLLSVQFDNNVMSSNSQAGVLGTYSDSYGSFNFRNSTVLGPVSPSQYAGALYGESYGNSTFLFVADEITIANTISNNVDGLLLYGFENSGLTAFVSNSNFSGNSHPISIQCLDSTAMVAALLENTCASNSNSVYFYSNSNASQSTKLYMDYNTITNSSGYSLETYFKNADPIVYMEYNTFDNNEQSASVYFDNTGDGSIVMRNNHFMNTNNGWGLNLAKQGASFLKASLLENTFSDNDLGPCEIFQDDPDSSLCLTFSGNITTNGDYFLSNVEGTYSVAPDDTQAANEGMIAGGGGILHVNSCD